MTHPVPEPATGIPPDRRLQPAESPVRSVSVTIVNHQARDQLRACLQSLRDHPYSHGTMEVIVADNSSGDGSVEMIRTEFPETVLLPHARRRGFGANQNSAAAVATGDALFILNPDAVVHPHTLDRLAAALSPQEGIVASGGPTVNDDGSLRQRRPHPFPTPWSPWRKAFGLHRLSRQTRGAPAEGWPSGGATMVDRRAFEAVGGFDERFFMYSEDTDLMARLVERGSTTVWVEDALVTHPHPTESSAMTGRRETEKVYAELRYIRKHFGRVSARVYQVGVVVDAALRVALRSVPALHRAVGGDAADPGADRRRQVARLGAATRGGSGPRLADLADEFNSGRGDAAATSAGPGLIVFDTGASWDGPWMAFQHIAGYLARRAPVLFVDAPESPVHAYRKGRSWSMRSPLVTLDDNLYRLTPSAPPGLTRFGIRTVTGVLVRRSVREAIRHLGGDVHAIVSNCSRVNLFDIAPADIRVYYVSDDFEAGAELMGRTVAEMKARDARGAEDADAIVVISEELAATFRGRGYDPVLVPNGVAVEVFADVDSLPRPPEITISGPIAGYIGHIGDRIDIALLEAVVDAGIGLLLIGPRQTTFRHDDRLRRLVAAPNVQWIGPRRFDELPAYMAVMDVGLVPYTDSAFNLASFPLKTLEYLAAGRPVVATPLPAIRWLDTELVVAEANPSAFGAAVATAALTVRTEEAMAERRRFADQHSWERRVDELAAVLGLPPR